MGELPTPKGNSAFKMKKALEAFRYDSSLKLPRLITFVPSLLDAGVTAAIEGPVEIQSDAFCFD